MSGDVVVRFPRLADNDSVWLRWIEAQGDELEISMDGKEKQAAVLQRFTEVMSQMSLSSLQCIRKVCFWSHDEPSPEDCIERNIALCALITLLHRHLELLSFHTDASALFLSLQFVPMLNKLHTLHLFESDCAGKGAVIAQMLRKCPNLTSLNLSESDLTDDDVACFGSFPSSLEVLDVSFSNLTYRGMEIVAGMLRTCPHLRKFDATQGRNDEEQSDAIEPFASLADKPRLESLRCSVDAVHALHHLQSMVNLASLSISLGGTGSDFEHFCCCVRGMSRLANFSLTCKNGLSVEGDRQLGDVLCSLDQLVSFAFESSEKVSLCHVAAFVASSKCRLSSLYVSDIESCDLSPLVAALKFNSSLQSLYMYGIKFDEGIVGLFVQAFRHNRTLRSFSSSYDHDTSPHHWTSIVEAARYSAIERLHVPVSGPMTDEMQRLLEDVANQGYLVSVGDKQASESCRKRMIKNTQMHVAARKTALTMLAVRRFRKSALNALQNDIVKLIAMSLFATRANDAWSNAFAEGELKRQKM